MIKHLVLNTVFLENMMKTDSVNPETLIKNGLPDDAKIVDVRFNSEADNVIFFVRSEKFNTKFDTVDIISESNFETPSYKEYLKRNKKER